MSGFRKVGGGRPSSPWWSGAPCLVSMPVDVPSGNGSALDGWSLADLPAGVLEAEVPALHQRLPHAVGNPTRASALRLPHPTDWKLEAAPPCVSNTQARLARCLPAGLHCLQSTTSSCSAIELRNTIADPKSIHPSIHDTKLHPSPPPGLASDIMSKSLVEISSKEQFDKTLKGSKIVVADFYADWCAPCKQIAPLYQTLAESLSRPNVVTFTKVNSDNNAALAQEYGVTALPTFLLFRDAKVTQKIQGANPAELKKVVQDLAAEVESLGEGSGGSSSGGGAWKGAEIPRGYSDISDQVEIRNCELLNADEDAGPVKVLFTESRPSALDKGKAAAKDKDWVQSGADDQLLLFVPFQGSVKLHTLQITSLPADDQDDITRPEVIRLYINRTQNMDFSEADETEPTQEITLKPENWNKDGTANVSLRYVKFQKTTTLVIYVERGTEGAEAVRIDRLKLIGEAGPKREMGKLQKVGEDE
ncbi:hypothetical protein Purlil1_9426 [Purpureocillium lilacinum]|uniref:Thioredoxin n=1 Tax=Purpureocillium lilacinum TaxID=33203 RepID=A0ABR0BR01_PURLI|nr:hypothetical protein Purlil1_9426 [Purpureocillium lilacinum]